MSHRVADVANPFGLSPRGSALAWALIAIGTASALVVPNAVAGSRIAASQPLVVLLHGHVARSAPSARAGRVETVAARRPLTRVRTVLPVLGRASSLKAGSWLRVRLPGRPNGHAGWISTNRTRQTSTPWRLKVALSTRRLTVYRGGDVRRQFRAVIGKPSTPTPRGAFFVEEGLALSSYETGGPFALATSARSNVFQEFEGGPGQIGIHGTNNLSGAPGSAASHGCIRLRPRAITWLARRIGAGVPLTVTR
ncbi:MAG TPA: L,D-transpeptidase [Solirubrobacterales bacterium]|nr:L,D-transpeptidase [Solirubrobacterales bacterium]